MRLHLCLTTCFAAVALFATAARADIISATMKFTHASELLAQADRARDVGAHEKALDLYKRTLNTYTELAREDPDFQPEMVEFRMEYCDGQLASLLNTYYQARTTAPTIGPSTSNRVDKASALDRPALPPSGLRIGELLIAARSHLAEGESEAARELLLKGFEIDPDNAALRLLAGLAQCQARKFSDAIYLLSELADEQPSNAPAHVALASAHFGSGATDKAQEELETAIRLDPDLGDAHYNLAQLLLTAPTPDLEAVNRHYRRARSLGAPPDLRVEKVIQYPGPDGADQ